jgi:hypothetical protein
MTEFISAIKRNDNLSKEEILFLEKESIPKHYKSKKNVSFFNSRCLVRIANNPALRRYVYEFIYKAYLKMGYTTNKKGQIWFSIYDALKEATILIAENEYGEMAGALTIVFDSPIGLPADKLYRKEIGELRENGAKICEIVSFATNEEVRGSVRFLAGLFYCVYLLARKDKGASDLIITVNDRQENFYCRNLMFDKIGSLKSYDKVNGAPAVLLRLDWELIDKLKNIKRIFPLSMFDYPDHKEAEIIQNLKDMISPMSHDEFIDLLSLNPEIWECSTPPQKEYILQGLRD